MQNVGILITHGTDTLAWTLAYVRYAIKNNHANICITGSQIPIPSTAAFSDAYENIENSMRFLSSLKPPNVFAVFNYGQDAFSDSLQKIDRWNNIAFTGDRIATMEWDEVKFHDKTIEILDPYQLDKFHLITTGGTIESEAGPDGVLSPGRNHVLGYISSRFSHFFRDLSQDPVFSIDSSDITFDLMEQVTQTVEHCLKESFDDTFADTRFDPDVKIIYTDPLKSRSQYKQEAEGASGVIIAGYGGGNVNIEEDSPFALLPVIRELLAKDIPVVLASQVPVGVADFIYQNGYMAIRAGALSAVDLSLPESQLRLSFILGHLDLIQATAQAHPELKLTAMDLMNRLFLSGTKFRNKRSLALFTKTTGIPLIRRDLLINIPFEQVLEELLKSLAA